MDHIAVCTSYIIVFLEYLSCCSTEIVSRWWIMINILSTHWCKIMSTQVIHLRHWCSISVHEIYYTQRIKVFQYAGAGFVRPQDTDKVSHIETALWTKLIDSQRTSPKSRAKTQLSGRFVVLPVSSSRLRLENKRAYFDMCMRAVTLSVVQFLIIFPILYHCIFSC